MLLAPLGVEMLPAERRLRRDSRRATRLRSAGQPSKSR
jgi:hypothetical protein